MLYRFSMRILPRSTGVALAALATLLLSGCLPSAPVVTPEPLPTSTPVFASDEMALAAATEAYRAYLAMSDQILIDGGSRPERIEAVSTIGWAKKQMPGFREATDKGLRSTGGTTFDTVSLQRYDAGSPDGVDIVQVYLCIDVSAVNVFDSSGASVVKSTRPGRSAVEVSFDSASEGARKLLVASVDPWPGTDFCA